MLFLLLSCELHLRSSGIRYQRLGTPAKTDLIRARGLLMQPMQVGLWSAEEQKVGLDGKMEIALGFRSLLCNYQLCDLQQVP